jgi:hypothetical protein
LAVSPGAFSRDAAHKRHRYGHSHRRIFLHSHCAGQFVQRLLEGKYVDGSALTITGRTFAQEAADAREATGVGPRWDHRLDFGAGLGEGLFS